VNGTFGTAFSGSDDISTFGVGYRYSCDVILMSWEVVDVLWLRLLFFDTTEESLFMCAQSLDNTKSC
jgi:hypothetical protein